MCVVQQNFYIQMPKTRRLKAGQFQYKTIILQFSEYIYKFHSNNPADRGIVKLLSATNNRIQKCFLQTRCTYQSLLRAQPLTVGFMKVWSRGRGSCSLGLLLMTTESSLCSQGCQSPQETAGLKQLTASPSRVLVSQIRSLRTYCVQNTSFHLPTQHWEVGLAPFIFMTCRLVTALLAVCSF